MEALRVEDFLDTPVEPLTFARVEQDYVKESPRHRVVVEMKATGRFNNHEISNALGYTPVTVKLILRQPWSQALLVKLMREQGNNERESTFKLLEGLTMEAAEKQREIMGLPLEDNVETVRKVTNDILNRVYGTPTATVKVTHKDDDLERLSDAEIAERIAELKKRALN